MSLVQGLIQRGLVLVFSCILGLFVLGKLVVETIKIGPGAAFSQKKRNRPPARFEDPSLGTHGYAYLENIRMHYVSNGAEDKPLMLLVHGFPEFWYSWRHQLREFKDSYRVVAVDLRGYGDSDKPPGIGNYSVSKLIVDLKQFVAALGYSECVLVGHDWGGALSWAVAAAFPEMVSRLVILNCPNAAAFNEEVQRNFTQLKMSWYMIFFQLPWLPEFVLRFNDFKALDYMFKGERAGVRTEHTTHDDLEVYKYNFARNGFTGPLNFYRHAFSLASLSDDGRKSRGITMPTLIVWGDRDRALSTSLAKLSAKACKGKVSIKYIEGASHWVQMDRPDLVNPSIREFLAEH